MYGVKLGHRSQFLGLAISNQGAFGDGGATHLTGNRREYLGVLHINAGYLNRTLGLGPGGHGIVVLLTADRVGIEQTLVPFGQVLGRLQVGFRACQLRFIGARINLIQLLTLLHLTAFGKQALLQNTRDLGADFRDAVGAGAAGQVSGQRQGFRLDGVDTDLRDPLGLLWWLCLTAAHQQCGCQGQHRRKAQGC